MFTQKTHSFTESMWPSDKISNLKKIPALADIEKSFLQTEIQSEERDVSRFLWFKDS